MEDVTGYNTDLPIFEKFCNNSLQNTKVDLSLQKQEKKSMQNLEKLMIKDKLLSKNNKLTIQGIQTVLDTMFQPDDELKKTGKPYYYPLALYSRKVLFELAKEQHRGINNDDNGQTVLSLAWFEYFLKTNREKVECLNALEVEAMFKEMELDTALQSKYHIDSRRTSTINTEETTRFVNLAGDIDKSTANAEEQKRGSISSIITAIENAIVFVPSSRASTIDTADLERQDVEYGPFSRDNRDNEDDTEVVKTLSQNTYFRATAGNDESCPICLDPIIGEDYYNNTRNSNDDVTLGKNISDTAAKASTALNGLTGSASLAAVDDKNNPKQKDHDSIPQSSPSLTKKFRVLSCGHIFHSECIYEWLIHQKGTCPVCGRDLLNDIPTAVLQIECEEHRTEQEEEENRI